MENFSYLYSITLSRYFVYNFKKSDFLVAIASQVSNLAHGPLVTEGIKNGKLTDGQRVGHVDTNEHLHSSQRLFNPDDEYITYLQNCESLKKIIVIAIVFCYDFSIVIHINFNQ